MRPEDRDEVSRRAHIAALDAIIVLKTHVEALERGQTRLHVYVMVLALLVLSLAVLV